MSTSTPDVKMDPKTLQRLRELSDRLPREWMTLGQAETIYRLLCRYERPPTRVLEIGTYLGRGAILLAAMVEPWGGQVTTVDLPWTGQPNRHFDRIADQWAADCGITNLQIVRRPDGAEGWLLDYARSGGKPLDFVFIDGGHDWKSVSAQFAMAMATIRPGGWICFDDTANSAWPEVGDAWRHVVCRLIPPERRYTVGQLGFAMRVAFPLRASNSS